MLNMSILTLNKLNSKLKNLLPQSATILIQTVVSNKDTRNE
jgi:hypothetical protein